ncbi:MAG: M13 family metallopeptidase [Saprospiraceae bacterium]|nr:M13 family metallopeptidase [Saprospiraceae bacterium]
MKKRYLFLCVATLVVGIAACSKKTAGGATSSKDIVTPAGQKKFIDPANFNTSVRPQDDFFEYANGTWIKNTPIPATESRWGSFNELIEFNQKALKAICEESAANPGAKGSINQKVGDLYALGMDSAAIEKAGIAPLKPYLDRIDNLKNYKDLLAYIIEEYAKGQGPLFGFFGGLDAKNSEAFVPQIGAGGINLPDRDYYLKDDERMKKVRSTYESHIFNVFRLMGDSETKAKAAVADIMRMETAYAKARLSRVELRDPDKRYNKMTIADLEKICPQMQWSELISAVVKGAKVDYVVASQPNFLKEVNNQLKNATLEDWKTYLRWNTVKGALPVLGSAFVAEGFRMQQALTGAKEMQPRWKRVSGLVDNLLGEALGQLYVEKHFKPEAKARMVELVGNLLKVYEKRINGLDWMSAETKTKALAKLSTFVRKIGYPDKWQDYTPLSIDRSKSYLDNIMAAQRFAFNDNISRIGKPVDKTRWGMTPPTVNAYYNPTQNEIVFPAGILQFPFFDNAADDAVNYGGIGAVIGHEISHGFDDQGRKFDLNGNLKEWWTEDDAKKFMARADMVVDQFNNYKVLDTVRVNGKLTLGENIADLGGLAVAYEAFKTYSPQAKGSQKIDGFTPEQRFFLSWAQVWRAKYRDEELANRILTDPHSPGKFRCNGPLTNMPEFYEVFGVKEGDKMYRPSKIRIW